MTNDSWVDSIRRYISHAILGFPQKITAQRVNRNQMKWKDEIEEKHKRGSARVLQCQL